MAKPFQDLVILAAGMGSRFGGVKQVQPVGPDGELIIEYSVFDARRAGFDRAVLVIRRDIEKDFRAAIGRRLESHVDVHYVFQEPGPQAAGRTKPWGTGHAVLAAESAVRGNFAAINADDYYGPSGFAALADQWRQSAGARKPEYALVGYRLAETLSEHGSVSRGVCATDAAGRLQGITEMTRIERTADGIRAGEQSLTGDERVSMNFWGFTREVFPQLARQFAEFVRTRGSDPKSEFYLPTAIDELNRTREADVVLLKSSDRWFGLTYREDLAAAKSEMAGLIAAGVYPAPLWG
ncbi:MAG TPA: NTP transferase domain-containing protein [Candidatus Didemnitutus sp.]|nr:NTP transferase domain-containing protein [Candidatus Didemnitutus sp.]